MIAALYVAKGGCYFGLKGVDPWDEARDARQYTGPHPVVAHPPCQLWTNLACLNFKRWGGEHNRPGNDGGCFGAALHAVQRWGGVIEHPAHSRAWDRYGLTKPKRGQGWVQCTEHFVRFGLVTQAWVCHVEQGHYGHRARKATWLYTVGTERPELNWGPSQATHQIGYFDRIKPVLGKTEVSVTPPPFRELLVSLARSVYTKRLDGDGWA